MVSGLIAPDSVRAELATLARGEHAGRQHAAEITVFKSVGSALSDLYAAGLAWQGWQARTPPDQG